MEAGVLDAYRLPSPGGGRKPDKQTFAFRCAYAQDLRAAGLTCKAIGELIGVQATKVPWYADPKGFSFVLFPVPYVVIDPSVVDGKPVFYDEWSTPTRDPNLIYMRLTLERLTHDGITEISFDPMIRETLFRGTGKEPSAGMRRRWRAEEAEDMAAKGVPPVGHLVQARPKLKQVLPNKRKR